MASAVKSGTNASTCLSNSRIKQPEYCIIKQIMKVEVFMNKNENNEEIKSTGETSESGLFAPVSESDDNQLPTGDMTYEIPTVDQKKEEELPPPELKSPKRTFLDFNFSWIMLLIDMAVIIGVGTLNIKSIGDTAFGASVNSTVYILLTVVVSALVGLLSYVGGKIIGGLLGGFRILEIDILGFSCYFPGTSERKNYCTFKLANFLDMHLIMVPRDDKKPNHFFYLLGGMFGYLLVAAIFLVLAFTVFRNIEWLYITVLYGMVYAFLIPFYQLFPCRLDYPNDCFLLIKTRRREDREAYYTELRNATHALRHDDFESLTFDSYDTYFKSHMLYYVYLDKLYKDDIDGAVETITDLQRYRIYYPTELHIKSLIEKLYLLLLSDSFEDADRVYSDLNREEQKALSNNVYLTQFRASVLIEAFIKNSQEDTQKTIREFEKYLEGNSVRSDRLVKEVAMFQMAVEKIKAVKPEWGLEYTEPALPQA